MKNRTSLWMAVSGITGLLLFLIANFTDIFFGLDVVAGILQLFANLFVLISWCKGFFEYSGIKKLIALAGVLVPVIMASITIYHVIVPSLL